MEINRPYFTDPILSLIFSDIIITTFFNSGLFSASHSTHYSTLTITYRILSDPDLINSLASDPEVIDSILANPEVLDALKSDPNLTSSLASNPNVIQASIESQPQICEF